MAEKRMLSKVISVSKKVNLRLTNHFSRLLYTWLIPHTDDFGRLTGCPHKVRALVVPMLEEITWREIEKTLFELSDVGLIQWYEVEGDKYIQVTNFEEHQSGLHKRTKSKIPEPPNSSGKFPEIPLEENRRELNRTEGKGIEENGTLMDLSPGNPHQERLRELLNACELKGVGIDGLETVYSYIGQVDIEVIEKAIKKSEKKHIPYFVSVINGWISEGKTTLESLNPIPKGGSPNGEHRRDSEGTNSKDKPITGGAVGWLPSEFRPEDL